MFALAAGHQINQMLEYLKGAASVNSDESVIKEKIWENLSRDCFYQNRCGGLPPIPGRMPEGGGPILSGLPGPRCP